MLQPSVDSPLEENKKLKRRWERERTARLEAESIAERGLRQLYEKKEQLQLLGEIAVAANESATIEELLRLTLVKISETSEWQLGHAYLAKLIHKQRRLISTQIWSDIDREWMIAFRRATEAMESAADTGLPGRVLSTGKTAWIADLSTEQNCAKAESIRLKGIKASFAFPVFADGEVAAVLEFVSERFTVPDEFFLQLMAEIGTQIGRLIERKRTEEQLIHDASHDPLTKLPNRALFMDRLTRALVRNKRFPDASFAVLFIDLDRFKVVNDTLGHNAGDALLIQVAARISASLRQEEMLARCGTELGSQRETLARLGGDEFTVLLDEPHDPSQIVRVAERIQKGLAQPFCIEGNELSVCASVGIATSATGYDSPAEVIHDADLAMYRAKSLGGSCFVIYDESIHALGVNRLQVETNLHRALQNGEFVLHYQPIVELRTGEIVGFEALIRWRRPDSELIYPDQFMKVAEETGLINLIGAWVLREACTVAHQWQQEFPRERPLTMSVNLSGRQFSQHDLVQQVCQVISDTCVAPGTVGLEITESVTMDDTDRTAGILSELAALGISFSIDDFGTGFSSLSYLHRFPIRVLKIDRSFVARIEADGEGLAIVRTIVNLARDLGMEVVAEGIETEGQAMHLQALRCKFGQGYLYSRPLDETSAHRLLQTQSANASSRRKRRCPKQSLPTGMPSRHTPQVTGKGLWKGTQTR
jgi:predicted signal transduction protein with EAL and GGDEF domain